MNDDLARESEADIIAVLCDVIRSDAGVSVTITDLDWNKPLGAGGLGLSSVGIFEVLVALEAHFSVTLQDDEMGQLVDATPRTIAATFLASL